MTATIGRATVTVSAPADAVVLAWPDRDHGSSRRRDHRLQARFGSIDLHAALLHQAQRVAATRRDLRVAEQVDDVDLGVAIDLHIDRRDVLRESAFFELLAECGLRLVSGRRRMQLARDLPGELLLRF